MLYLLDLGCCGYLCRPCQMGDNAQKLGDSYFLCCFASICVPCIPAFILRQKTRERYNINGDSCEDALASIFCACCTSVQIANELNDKGA